MDIIEKMTKEQPLHIAITGASGLIGTALSQKLQEQGHIIEPLVRNKAQLAQKNGAIYWNPATQELDLDAFSNTDVVIHLAGESIAGGRWSAKKKARILDSRTQGTTLISQTLQKMPSSKRPKLLISASATGFYGDGGDEILDEESGAGTNFLADVCQKWEQAADAAKDAGIRVVHPRIGLVLSKKGGALPQMLLPFYVGAGGKMGSGKQWMSWIGLSDLIRVFEFAIQNEQLQGALNATAPNPLQNEQFVKVLGKAVRRPSLIPTPGFALKIALGSQMATELLLTGQRALPKKLEQHGFTFEHAALQPALEALNL